MNAASSTSRILLAPWQQLDPATRWPRRLIWACALVGTIVIVALTQRVSLRLAVAAGLADLLLQFLWVMLASSLTEQNHPTLARLAPGHRQQLLRVTMGGWLTVSGLGTLLLWAGLPPLPFSLATLWLVHSALGVYLFWAVRQWQLWLLSWLLPSLFFSLNLGHRLQPLWQSLAQLWQGQPVLCGLLAAALLATLLAHGLGRGDARHRANYELFTRMRRAMRGQRGGPSTGFAAWGRPGEWLTAPVERAMAFWLHRSLTSATPARASVMRRAEIVLHGSQHWLRQGLTVLLILAFVGLCLGVAGMLAGPHFGKNWKSGAFGMAIGLMSMGINPAFMLPAMLWHSRREQALLRLLPGMPQGKSLNRAVARLQLRHTLTAWLLCTTGLVVLALAADHVETLALGVAALPVCVAWPLSAPACMRAPGSYSATVPIGLYIVLMVGVLWLNQSDGVPMLAMAAVSLALSIAAGVWRWRRLLAAPTALPAGRLG
ncbi:MAG: hypothetical protein DI603_14430 [Roseateles depolymerans]|uniref:Uncharacterized protein n=1 Tax=Roseateles depolymerans TaxID=76731 RepID=A0A2W5DFP1_9BURK|nr:MAG: hypothetical protein DI603_14430 [Roseateles depolymerans]